jgi:RND family efflux transporter MFP subunit
VQAISYADGDYVKKGTSLFTIEPEPYRLKVEAAKASVTSAQATLKQNEAEYARQADLVQRQVSAVATYDKALALRDSAQADLQSAQANERQAEINLGYTNVTAPFDGIVSARQVSIGQLVGANSATVLSTIVQLNPIYVNFTASERERSASSRLPRALRAYDCRSDGHHGRARAANGIRLHAAHSPPCGRSASASTFPRCSPSCCRSASWSTTPSSWSKAPRIMSSAA